MQKREHLNCVLETRLENVPKEILRRFRDAEGVIVFGSFACGVQTDISDLDVFCVGASKTHWKSPSMELLILPEYELYSELWLGSELANHIKIYGVPLDATPAWFSSANVSREAVQKKRRRVNAYLRALNKYWLTLSKKSQTRFHSTLRRELQRLDLLTEGQAVPPTKMLDLSFLDTEYASYLELGKHLTSAERVQLKNLSPQWLCRVGETSTQR